VKSAAGLLLGWLAAHTYAVVFVGTLIDASGVPFPGRLLLIAAGAVAATDGRSLVGLIVLGAVAAMVMDHVWYLAATWGSEWVVALYRRLTGWSGADPDTARAYFTRYGAATIVVGRFFTSVRALAWPMAAAHGVGYATFFALDLAAALLWAALWVVLGWVVGDRWASVVETAGAWSAIAGALVFALALAPVAMRLWRRHRRPQRS
jgi:membrane protein DedA with SNARE-associated domain